MVKGLVIPAEGAPYFQNVKTLQDFKSVVGGYLEAVNIPPDMVMYVNEEGKMSQLPTNGVATTLAWTALGIPPNDYIVGDVIIVGYDGSPDEAEIPEAAQAFLRDAGLWPTSTGRTLPSDPGGGCANCGQEVGDAHLRTVTATESAFTCSP